MPLYPVLHKVLSDYIFEMTPQFDTDLIKSGWSWHCNTYKYIVNISVLCEKEKFHNSFVWKQHNSIVCALTHELLVQHEVASCSE